MRASAAGDRGARGGTSGEGLGAFNPSFGEADGGHADFRAFVEVFAVFTGGATALTFAFALDKRPTFQYNVCKHGDSLHH